ncbi:unnamed protein product [Xylocopa violacea]|uniref:Uncharacterized protein n=1 Tax=Xylocopa violacea TaxID=135666 RepID=A0ABP1N431_XYLVO
MILSNRVSWDRARPLLRLSIADRSNDQLNTNVSVRTRGFSRRFVSRSRDRSGRYWDTMDPTDRLIYGRSSEQADTYTRTLVACTQTHTQIPFDQQRRVRIVETTSPHITSKSLFRASLAIVDRSRAILGRRREDRSALRSLFESSRGLSARIATSGGTPPIWRRLRKIATCTGDSRFRESKSTAS